MIEVITLIHYFFFAALALVALAGCGWLLRWLGRLCEIFGTLWKNKWF
jgi:hypothetical protein